MLKSPSAKELGRHRVQPMAPVKGLYGNTEDSSVYQSTAKLARADPKKAQGAAGGAAEAQGRRVGQGAGGPARSSFKQHRQTINTSRPATAATKTSAFGLQRQKFTPGNSMKVGPSGASTAMKPPTNQRRGTEMVRKGPAASATTSKTAAGSKGARIPSKDRGAGAAGADQNKAKVAIPGSANAQLGKLPVPAALAKPADSIEAKKIEHAARLSVLEEVKQDELESERTTQRTIMPFDADERKQIGINTHLLDCEEEGELTRPHRFAYDSILQPANSLALQEQRSADGLMDFDGAKGHTARPAFASFIVVPHTERDREQDSDSLRIDFKDDLDEQASARLDKMMTMKPARTHSHFVELNDNNEDMLLEGINGDEDERRLNDMLLDEAPDLERDGDELLI